MRRKPAKLSSRKESNGGNIEKLQYAAKFERKLRELDAWMAKTAGHLQSSYRKLLTAAAWMILAEKSASGRR